jgi:hypothetical protein
MKRDEVIGELRDVHNEELRGLYFLLSMITMTVWRRVGWDGMGV